MLVEIVAAALLASWAWMARRFIAQLDATTKLAQKTAEQLEKISNRLDRIDSRG